MILYVLNASLSHHCWQTDKVESFGMRVIPVGHGDSNGHGPKSPRQAPHFRFIGRFIKLEPSHITPIYFVQAVCTIRIATKKEADEWSQMNTYGLHIKRQRKMPHSFGMSQLFYETAQQF